MKGMSDNKLESSTSNPEPYISAREICNTVMVTVMICGEDGDVNILTVTSNSRLTRLRNLDMSTAYSLLSVIGFVLNFPGNFFVKT